MNKANIEPTSTTRGSTLSIFKSVSYEATKMKRRLSKVRISNSVPGPGLEPGWVAPTVFETVASTDSAIRAYICGAKLGLLPLICKFFILNRAVVTFFLLILQDIT